MCQAQGCGSFVSTGCGDWPYQEDTDLSPPLQVHPVGRFTFVDDHRTSPLGISMERELQTPTLPHSLPREEGSPAGQSRILAEEVVLHSNHVPEPINKTQPLRLRHFCQQGREFIGCPWSGVFIAYRTKPAKKKKRKKGVQRILLLHQCKANTRRCRAGFTLPVSGCKGTVTTHDHSGATSRLSTGGSTIQHMRIPQECSILGHYSLLHPPKGLIQLQTQPHGDAQLSHTHTQCSTHTQNTRVQTKHTQRRKAWPQHLCAGNPACPAALWPMKCSAKPISGAAANTHFFLSADVCKLQISRCLSKGACFFCSTWIHTPYDI